MKYDFKKAKQFIEENKESIESASMGMHEDWFWTAETIFKDGEYLVDLEKEDLKIGGISGSYWATPVLQIEYKDGQSKTYHCHDNGEHREPDFNAKMFISGAITQEVQIGRSKIELEEIE